MSQQGDTTVQEHKDSQAADELRRATQIQFDPAVHGVGTTQTVEPESVKQLFQYVQRLESRIKTLERNSRR